MQQIHVICHKLCHGCSFAIDFEIGVLYGTLTKQKTNQKQKIMAVLPGGGWKSLGACMTTMIKYNHIKQMTICKF